MEEFLKKYQKEPVIELSNNVAENPTVSVCVQAYQHANYIKDCLEGILMQKTNFDFEILLGEDESSDGTREICINYAERYPDKIKLFLHSRANNIKINGHPTGRFNLLYNLTHACGKYIALCEGDDYWTDPLKLQKQVDFLEANPEDSLCFHNAIIMWDDKSQPPKYFCAKDQKETSTIADVIDRWFIPSASMVFRSEYISPLPSWFKDIYNGDWALHMLCADKGKIRYLDEVMSVYRKNEGALSAGVGKDVAFINTAKTKLLELFDSYSGKRNSEIIQIKIAKLKIETEGWYLRRKNIGLYYIKHPAKFLTKVLNRICRFF